MCNAVIDVRLTVGNRQQRREETSEVGWERSCCVVGGGVKVSSNKGRDSELNFQPVSKFTCPPRKHCQKAAPRMRRNIGV